ncbi:outer membrane immunogenic protein [Hyphomicrobium sp. 1Nfss2.1]|uniref:outer membrane protein n=1 Tax=Hyphomicrobium sp. 1Nfss2.1 TaxID=3413936 RepID=UPI003C7CD893
MRLRLALAAGFAACFVAGANAGDNYNWSGLYVGAHGGYSDWSLSRPDDSSSPTQGVDGGFGGAQIGFDHQIPGSRIVLGALADVSFGDLDNNPITDGGTILVHSGVDRFGTIRGRLGYSFGHILAYGTGGAAWVKGSTTEECPTTSNPFSHCGKAGLYTETDDFTRWGWAYGGGLEAKLTDNLSLFAEYVRLDFGTETHVLGPKSNPREVDITSDTVRVGFNYRFGGRDEPVPLK